MNWWSLLNKFKKLKISDSHTGMTHLAWMAKSNDIYIMQMVLQHLNIISLIKWISYSNLPFICFLQGSVCKMPNVHLVSVWLAVHLFWRPNHCSLHFCRCYNKPRKNAGNAIHDLANPLVGEQKWESLWPSDVRKITNTWADQSEEQFRWISLSLCSWQIIDCCFILKKKMTTTIMIKKQDYESTVLKKFNTSLCIADIIDIKCRCMAGLKMYKKTK